MASGGANFSDSKSDKERAVQWKQEADVAAHRGDHALALERIDSALALRDRLGPGLIFTLQLTRADLLRAQQDYPGALAEIDRILSAPAADYQFQYHARALLLRALVFHHWGLSDQTCVAYESAVEIAAKVDRVIGATAREIEELSSDTTQETDARKEKRADREGRYRYLVRERDELANLQRYVRGVDLLAREEYDEVIRHCAESIAELDRRIGEATVSKERSQLELIAAAASLEFERVGRRNFAPLRGRFVDLASDSALSASERERARLRVVQIDLLLGDEAKVAESFINHPPSAEGAFASESARLFARYALEVDRSPDTILRASEIVAQAFRRESERWRSTPLREGGLGILSFLHIRALLSESIRLARALGRTDEESLSLWFDAAVLDSLSREFAAPVPTVKEIRTHLIAGSRHRGIIAFLPAIDRSHLIAVGDSRVAVFELPNYDELVTRCRQLADEVSLARSIGGDASRESRERVDQMAAQLGSTLFPQDFAAMAADWREISMVGAEMLDRCPFEIIPFRNQEPMGTAVAVDFLPSLGFAISAPTRIRGATRSVVRLIAAPARVRDRTPHLELEDGTVLPSIQLSIAQAERILDAYGSPTQLHFGVDASWPPDQSREFESVAVLELLTHGGMDLSSPRPARLVVNERNEHGLGWLDAHRVDRTFGKDGSAPPIVILAACGSGIEAKRRGDAAASSLAGAWLANGSRAVIVSMSELDLRVAVDLSKSLHSRLAQGISPSEAVRSARAELTSAPRSIDPLELDFVRVIGMGHEKPPSGLRPAQPVPPFLLVLPPVVLIALVILLRGRRATSSGA